MGYVAPRATTPPDSSSEPTATVETGRPERRLGALELAPAGLDQHVAARPQPGRRLGDHPALHRQPVGAAVERDAVLVVARLARHQRDRLGRDVRRVGGHHVHPRRAGRSAAASYRSPSKTRSGGRLRRAQATAAGSTSTAYTSTPGTRASTAAAIAPMPQPRSTTTDARRDQRDDLVDQQSGALPRHEDPGRDREPQPAELDPADQLLQRLAGLAPGRQRLELVAVVAASASRAASSSANTQPAARSRATSRSRSSPRSTRTRSSRPVRAPTPRRATVQNGGTDAASATAAHRERPALRRAR